MRHLSAAYCSVHLPVGATWRFVVGGGQDIGCRLRDRFVTLRLAVAVLQTGLQYFVAELLQFTGEDGSPHYRYGYGSK